MVFNDLVDTFFQVVGRGLRSVIDDGRHVPVSALAQEFTVALRERFGTEERAAMAAMGDLRGKMPGEWTVSSSREGMQATVNGMMIPDVVGMVIDSKPGQIPMLVLTIAPRQGILTVAPSAPDVDPTDPR